MLLQQLSSGCTRCHTQRLFKYMCNRGLLHRPVQARQLVQCARMVLGNPNNPVKQVQHIEHLVHRLAAKPTVFKRLFSQGKSSTRQLLRKSKDNFCRPVRCQHGGKEKEITDAQKKFVENFAKRWENSHFKNGITPPQAILIVLASYMIWHFFVYEEKEEPEKPKLASNTTVTLYRKMPLKPMSRLWGKMTCWELPETLRQPLLGLYVWMFGVQLHEALDDNLKNYKNLNEFFRRELKPEVRIVDPVAPVTSPADGRVLHFGKVEDGIVEQVKGVNYSIQGFLGPQPGDEERTKPLKDSEYQEKMNIKPGYDLYNCIIYLAPGDYHRFHSPSDWKIAHRRHFPGELLSVNPGVARWVQGLFNMNERAVYSGTWEHGYFSYTPVGATNVGSIRMYFDENLETNTGASHPNHVYHDRSFGSPGSPENVDVRKGIMMGEFNLGSTIVLLFEAPSSFQFSVQPGQKVQFGESLGGFVN